ncbi:MAG: helix-turn-helix transcriptional regulator [Acidobacteria bacterium]|nr:helix-turn-helix transcriptional regulator [Acidobacteriota bacterium]
MPDNSTSNPLDSTTTLSLTLPPIDDRRILAVIVKLQSDLAHHFTPEELAKVAHLSASYMQARFSELVKKPMEKFQQEIRVKAAHDLFVTEFLTVQEVMARVGLRDRKRFYRDFKAEYHMTPGVFRKLCLQGKCPTAV